MSGKHSDGPWRWEGVSLLDANGEQIIWPYNIPNHVDDDTPMAIRMGSYGTPEMKAEANARLIVSAPELLDALEKLVVVCTQDDLFPHVRGHIHRAIDAIAKAKGE